MNADLRKMQEVEEVMKLPPLPHTLITRITINKAVVTMVGSSVYTEHGYRPYLIDSAGVPPREGEDL